MGGGVSDCGEALREQRTQKADRELDIEVWCCRATGL